MTTEWLYNIGMWFVENKDKIVTVVISGQALTFVAGLIAIIRQFKSIRNNTHVTDKLNQSLNATNDMSSSVVNLGDATAALANAQMALTGELTDIKDKTAESLAIIVDKVNTMLEVQSIVYSTIKDDDMRKTVNTLLNNSRYSEINLKDQFQQQLDSLKNQVDKQLTAVTNTVDDAVKQAKIVNNITPVKPTVTTRY